MLQPPPHLAFIGLLTLAAACVSESVPDDNSGADDQMIADGSGGARAGDGATGGSPGSFSSGGDQNVIHEGIGGTPAAGATVGVGGSELGTGGGAASPRVQV